MDLADAQIEDLCDFLPNLLVPSRARQKKKDRHGPTFSQNLVLVAVLLYVFWCLEGIRSGPSEGSG